MRVYCSGLLPCCRDRPIRGSRDLHKERYTLEVGGDGSLSGEKFVCCVVDGGVHAVDQCSSTQPVDCFVQVNPSNVQDLQEQSGTSTFDVKKSKKKMNYGLK